MPLVRGCRNRYCPEYAGPDGWCDAHRPAPFYTSPELPPGWPAIRATQLAAFPLCHECGAVATEVHHVRGRRGGHGPDNLWSLCGSCHATITHREAGWLSRP
jgi:5-methylcytosine-specific restriction endonuclease McrA